MFVRRSCWPFCEAFRRSQTLLFIWPVVILSRAIYKVLICINKKKKRKKCFLHSYHSVLLLIHSGIFNFNINIQFCYLLYIYIYIYLFSVSSSFFSFLVHVNVKLYKSIEQLYCYLEILKTKLLWVNGFSS